MSQGEMPPPIPTGNKKPRKSLPCMVWVCIGIAILMILAMIAGVVAMMVWTSSNRNELESIEAELRADGLPVTLEELDAWVGEVDDSENAALRILDAVALLEEIDPEGERSGPLLDVLEETPDLHATPASFRSDLAAYVDDLGPVLSKLGTLDPVPLARYPGRYSDGMHMNLEHLRALRGLARTLNLVTCFARLDGDGDLAAASHGNIVALGNSLASAPHLLSQLVRAAIHGITFDDLGPVLNTDGIQADQLFHVAARWQAAEAPNAWIRTLIADRCTHADTMAQLFDGTLKIEGDPENQQALRDMREAPAFMRNQLSYDQRLSIHRAYGRVIADSEDRWPEVIERSAGWNDLGTALVPLAEMWMPQFDYALLAFVRMVAMARVADTAIAVATFKEQQGTLPDSLEALVEVGLLETIPEDPFDGAPLRYKLHPDSGYMVYSIGEDLQDDGGTPMENRIGDLIVTVSR